jgi:hypothetical protein
MRALAQAALAGVLAGVLGCSLLVDTSDLDSGCPEGTKNCPGAGCVRLTDPAFGCGLHTCAPCENLTNAVAVCIDLRCEGPCLEGFACTGCLVNILTDEQNCGGCCTDGEPCPFRCESGEVCKEGVCTPASR